MTRLPHISPNPSPFMRRGADAQSGSCVRASAQSPGVALPGNCGSGNAPPFIAMTAAECAEAVNRVLADATMRLV